MRSRMKKTVPLSFLVMVAVLAAMAAEPVFGADPNGTVVPGSLS